MAMTEEAREARRAYKRNWQRSNPTKCKEYQERYWAKKAAQNAQEVAEMRISESKLNA